MQAQSIKYKSVSEWCTPVSLVLPRLKQAGFKFESNMKNTASSRPAVG